MSVTLRFPTPSLSQHPGWWPCSPHLIPFHTKHLAPNLGIQLGLLLITCSFVLEEKWFEGRDFVLLMMLPRAQYLACSECSINICKTIHAMKPSENRTQSRPSGRTWPRVNFVKGRGRGCRNVALIWPQTCDFRKVLRYHRARSRFAERCW